ncbi:MAG: hypothetical protein OES38_20650 [Gammaproteobacteria bacterium]|nr:hypothetical protein [Gammaproteobacteria bacterium]
MLRTQWQSYLDQHVGTPQATRGVCHLPELSVLEFSGPDAVTFLQGYLTRDTAELPVNQLAATAVCNLKGRVVVNGWCFRGGDHIPDQDADQGAAQRVTLVVHRSLTERLAEFFKAYLMFSKTTLTDLSDTAMVFGAPEAVAGLAIAANQRLVVTRDLAAARSLWESAPHGSANWWWQALIKAEIPVVTEATSEAFLPQMLGLEKLGAIDFDKGCYLGQEVVARAQHRGEVKRRLQRLRWRGPRPAIPGDSLTTTDTSDRKIGTVINSTSDLPAKSTPEGSDTGSCLAIVSVDAEAPFQHEATFFDLTT